MPFYAIQGTFHVVGYSPDGDSIRFKANDRTKFDLLDGPDAELNAREHAQLRLEAIDSLETHYQGAHQPIDLANAAMESLLGELGITDVQWSPSGSRVTGANDGTVGYILTRAVEPNRRPVSFAYAGACPYADGESVFLDVDRLRQSVNYKQVAEGYAYPCYYKGFFHSLRREFTAATNAARAIGRRIWASDVTTAGFDVSNPADITTDHVMFPKLFRRLSQFFENGGSIGGFMEFLDAKDDGVTIISDSHFTHFDTVVEVNGNTVRMTEAPENLMFEG